MLTTTNSPSANETNLLGFEKWCTQSICLWQAAVCSWKEITWVLAVKWRSWFHWWCVSIILEQSNSFIVKNIQVQLFSINHHITHFQLNATIMVIMINVLANIAQPYSTCGGGKKLSWTKNRGFVFSYKLWISISTLNNGNSNVFHK